jgi:hypothetical protein
MPGRKGQQVRSMNSSLAASTQVLESLDVVRLISGDTHQ